MLSSFPCFKSRFENSWKYLERALLVFNILLCVSSNKQNVNAVVVSSWAGQETMLNLQRCKNKLTWKSLTSACWTVPTLAFIWRGINETAGFFICALWFAHQWGVFVVLFSGVSLSWVTLAVTKCNLYILTWTEFETSNCKGELLWDLWETKKQSETTLLTN